MNHVATDRQGGFSLLEALLAAALVLVITLGIMPLFTTSIVQNVSGRESTLSSNYSRSTAEEMISLPLDRELLRPPVSQISREVCQDYEDGVGWDYVICGDPLIGEPKWTRELNVQQYSIREIYDADTASGQPTFKNPIPGYAAVSDSRLDSFVHLREVMVITEGQRAPNSPLGKGRRVDVINLRGF